ncbi:MAG: hypothetical protein EON47_17770 [Acetobacteraceae bacterium]|nr:MAG: hypothetical protein EON47_17770 [Acetobacteraceae bacterium]
MVCLASHHTAPMHGRDLWGLAMQPYCLLLQAWGQRNAGCVPYSRQMLDGARNVSLGGVHHGATVTSGGDHLDLVRLTHALLALVA